MKHHLSATAAAIGLAVLAFGSPADAAFIPTTSTFFTAPADGKLIFTYQGFSAGDTDTMYFAFNGNAIFTNQSTGGGTVHIEPVLAGNTYKLTLQDFTVPNTWSSDPSLNSDGANHLAGATNFADFGIGAAPFPITTNCAGPGGTCYLGWEDRPFPSADGDFNDLVFSMQFVVPEPASLALLGTALIGAAPILRRRRKTG